MKGINYVYHATERPCSMRARVRLELTIIKSRYGSFEVIMVSAMTSEFSCAKKEMKLNELQKKCQNLLVHC